ncbi:MULTISPECIES: rhomboid family intramembrane serine protease [Mycobacteriaceae]|uniref:rhomboid family intramembrane serine protease n=1 Tax=Mycobacteriaceae TaxID=1762 RepID=UPI0007FF7316|nr:MULTISPECIES: rhomboid family intramembrane serine protease [Mycobacteriaceae]MCK0176130.1 rhomboid family intramembrane serine protease [Mycolicibacterium sp. F2034L]OBB58272.1 rhomboid family intramembrane serine protease [Mycobacterium sp. 852013-51886_SCH5428379]
MSYPPQPYPQSPVEAPTCYRHPDRPTYVQCTRCGRFICPDCMRSAAVGHQCPDCVEEGSRSIRQPRTQFGGRMSDSATPVLTYVLIAVNVLVAILQTTSGDLESRGVMWSPAVADGQWYRLITSAFMHYGIMHLLFNMWALYVVGPPLESWLGRLRFGALYGLSALGGSVVVYLASPINAATAGASGAVFGLFGALFVVSRRLNFDIRGIAAIIVINLVFTFVYPLISGQAVSWQAHLGGLATGAAIAAVYAYAPRNGRTAIHAGATAAVVVVFVALIWWRTGQILDLYALR